LADWLALLTFDVYHCQARLRLAIAAPLARVSHRMASSFCGKLCQTTSAARCRHLLAILCDQLAQRLLISWASNEVLAVLFCGTEDQFS
jgi:hypothetical protein